MIQHIPASQYREQPWKNGGGLTREIAVALSGDPPRVLWRLSLATIERDGPFSEFRGYDRAIVAIDGDPVTLDVAGERIVLMHGHPHEFAGEAAVACRLTGGPARDLNVMTLRSNFVHDLEVIDSPQRFVLDEDEIAFVFAIDGEAAVDGVACEPGDTLRIRTDGAIAVTTAGSAAVVRVTPI